MVVDGRRSSRIARYDINDLPDPFLLPDMVPAVDRINRAIDTGEHVHVIADSDVDGICAAAIIINTLRRLRVHIRAYRKSLWLLKSLTSVGSGSLRISGEFSSAEERKVGSASSGIKQKMTFSICSKGLSTNKLFHFDRACFSSDFRLEQLFP